MRSSALFPRFRPAAALSAVLLLCAACDGHGPTDGGEGSAPPRLTVLSGAGRTDTIQAILPEPLVVEVRVGGRPKSNTGVVFQALPPDGEAGGAPRLLLNADGLATYEPQVQAATDARGRASVRVRFQGVAGPARVRASVQGVEATAEYTVAPGAPFGIGIFPRDTAVYVGARYTLRAGRTDRMGNLAAAPRTFASSANLAVGDDGVVTATAVGRGRVDLRSGAYADFAFVSVVPRGELALVDLGGNESDAQGIATVGLDQSGYRMRVPFVTRLPQLTLANAPGDLPRWVGTSGRLVFARETEGRRRLFTAEPDGSTRPLIAAAPEVANELDPAPSFDGAWIYFVGREAAGDAVWRVRADGAAPERVVPAAAGELRWPAVSPDGRRLAYVARAGAGEPFRLYLRDLASGAVARLGDAAAASPRWSPRGDWIAYVSPGSTTRGPVWVVRPDGTGAFAIAPQEIYLPGLDWSPDGAYLVIHGPLGMALIESATGNVLPLAFPWLRVYAPAWRPE